MREVRVEQRYYNVREIAKYLGTTPYTVYDWKRKRKIPFIKLDGSLKFDKVEIDKIMIEKQIEEMD